MKYSTFCISLLISISSLATTKNLNWNHAVGLATENNPTLRAAKENLKSIRFLEEAADSGYYPQLSANLATSQTYLSTATTNPSYTSSAYLSLNQNLFSGFSDLYKKQQASQNTSASVEALKNAESKLIADLKKAYSELIYAQDLISLSEKIYQRRKANSKNVELRFSGGRENKGSVLLSQAYLAQADMEKESAILQHKVAQSQLHSILGVSEQQQPIETLAVDSIESITTATQKIDVQNLILQSAAYKQAIFEEQSTKSAVEIAKSSYYPSLDLTGTYGKSDSTNWPPNSDRWNIGLTLSFSLFDGGKISATKNSTLAKWSAAVQNRHSVEFQLRNSLEQKHADFLTAEKKVNIDQKFKEAAQIRAEIARQKYNNGLMSFDDWDQVESDLILREKNFLASRRDLISAEAEWIQTLGQGYLK